MKKRGYEAFSKDATTTQNPNQEPVTKRQKSNGSSSTQENIASQQSNFGHNKPNGYSPSSETKSSQYTALPRDKRNGSSTIHRPNSSSSSTPHAPIPSPMPTPIPHPSQSNLQKAPSTLPPLPQIHNPTLRTTPFIHQGTLPQIPLSQATSQSYERLEWLGDAYLQLLSSRLIYTSFPHYTPGRLSSTRELLVRNETLAGFACAYGFDKRVKVPSGMMERGAGGKWSAKMVKVLGDVFEAYVAAVVLDDPGRGVETLEAWLRGLWEPLLAGEGMPSSSSDTLNGIGTPTPKIDFAKVELAKKMVSKGIKIEYRHEVDPQEVRGHTRQRHDGKEVFKMGCYLTGWGYKDLCLGVGDGLNKTEAGNEAASNALGNPITKEIEGKKREFDEVVRREREEKEKVLENGGQDGGELREASDGMIGTKKDTRRECMRDVAVQVDMEEDWDQERKSHEATISKAMKIAKQDRSQERKSEEVLKTKVKKHKHRKEVTSQSQL